LSAIWVCQAIICLLTKMKIKLIHPLWTHLPALLLIVTAVVFTLMAFPLPDSAPTHFDINGKPDGYGIRFDSEMQAYFLKGDRGVLVSAAGGKRYLLGSDHPEQLAAVIDAARA